MARFKGFKPQGLQKIATRMGYAGSMENFDDYLKQNPDKEREMIVYRTRAQEMAKGGSVVKLQTGGLPDFGINPPSTPTPQAQPRQLTQANVPTESDFTADDTIGSVSAKMMETPTLPEGGVTIPVGTQVTEQQWRQQQLPINKLKKRQILLQQINQQVLLTVL